MRCVSYTVIVQDETVALGDVLWAFNSSKRSRSTSGALRAKAANSQPLGLAGVRLVAANYAT